MLNDDHDHLAKKFRRLLDRFEQVIGPEMGRKPQDPPPLEGDGMDDPVSMARRTLRASTRLSIGPRTLEVREFIVSERRANRPFPTIDAITDRMGWPKDGAHRQAKDAIKRLKNAGKLPIFRKAGE